MCRAKLWLTALAGCLFLALRPELALALDPSRTILQYNCRSWQRENGLPANGINAIIQTKDGFLWLGTRKGLVRFDGIEFNVLPLPEDPHFRFQTISALANSRDGGLWFGIQNGEFGHYRTDIGFTTMPDQPLLDPGMNLHALWESSDGGLWLGSDLPAARLVGGRTNLSRSFGDEKGCLTIFEDRRQRVWLGTVEPNLRYWAAGQLVSFPDPSITNELVLAMTEDGLGRIWIGTQFGLRCYDAALNRVALPDVPAKITCMLTDRHGVVWIGTSGSGICRFMDGQYSYFKKNDGLADDDVTTLFEDREGSVWVGTRNGLTQLSDVRFPLYWNPDTLPNAHGVCASTNGGLWVGNSSGVSYFDGHQQLVNYLWGAGLSSSWVKTPFESRNGDLYLCNARREIEILAGGKVVARHHYQDQWPNGFAEDNLGVLVAVGEKLLRVSREKLDLYAFKPGTERDFRWIRSLASCHDGTILVASVNGLYRVKNGDSKRVGVERGLPANDVLWACEDETGVIWTGLTGGVGRIQGERVDAFTRDQGLFDNFIQSIVPDHHGWLWMQSGQGIFRVRESDFTAVAEHKSPRLQCEAYDGLESVKTTETADTEYSACRTSDGRIWFPSSKGLIAVDPDHVPANASAPLVHIQRARINGADCLRQGHAEVPVGKGELEVQFDAATFIAPEKVQFRYQLEGYTTNWFEAGARRSAFFTNLKPGIYHFLVQACNADGIWSINTDSFTMELLPYYYQTGWFEAASGILGAWFLIIIYRWQVARLRQKQNKLQAANAELESRVRERTRELAEQRNLLRTLIDHLPDHFFVKDVAGKVVINNLAHARTLGVNRPEDAVGKSDQEDRARLGQVQEQSVLERGEIYNGEEMLVDPQTGKGHWYQVTKVPLHDGEGRITGLAGLRHDITDRKEWETKLHTLHQQLVKASREAGMAEVAINVLHNVGNVLNSMNISGSLIETKIQRSHGDQLTKIAALLREHEKNLAEFFHGDVRGQKLLPYFEQLAKRWQQEKKEILEEVTRLISHLDHIKQIIATQQRYARFAAMNEIVKVSEVVEEVLRLNTLNQEDRPIQIVREFSEVPDLSLDRHKLMQILVNLIQNARQACASCPQTHPQIWVRIGMANAKFVKVEVRDNGVGIAPENLNRIFSHGFTTRKDGHGFGLHSAALAAQEMAGTLTVSSPGLGQGAVFVLQIPVGTTTPSPSKS
jgi:PAS domain S-box-containing protein